MDKEILHKYFAGTTSVEEEAQIIDWAEASPDNYKEYLKERKLWNALLVNYGNHEKQTTVSASPAKVVNLWKWASIAASLALIVTVSWMILGTEKGSEGLQAVLVPAGQRVQLVLEDGTKVWLNSKTKFTYPTSFGSGTREVQLDGEGFFEVSRNEEKPFIVKTQKYNIKVLGTTFNVSAYSHQPDIFETSLLHGSVDVWSASATEGHVLLRTKEKVSEVNGALKKAPIDNLDRFRWKDGLICLDDVPFANLMKMFSLYYDVQVMIDNPRVLDYRCTGKFRQSDGVEYALKVIQKDLKFSFTRDNESNTITIK